MEDLNGLSISFSSVFKELQLDYLAGKRLDMSEAEELLEKLKHVDLIALKNDDQKKAFWINIYNGLTNYLVVNKRIKRSIICNLHLFSLFKIPVGDFQWSLNQIEHGLLRRNSIPPFHLRKPLGNGDHRLKMMLKAKDERIHFALNCGGLSCPMIHLYNYENIEQDLEAAKEQFLEHNLHIDDENKSILCSPIFKWYKRDFEGKYMFAERYRSYTITYAGYDWSLDLRTLKLS